MVFSCIPTGVSMGSFLVVLMATELAETDNTLAHVAYAETINLRPRKDMEIVMLMASFQNWSCL